MILKREDYKSYFGLFTFHHVEKPELVWTGKTDEIRVEISASDGSDENWLAVMFLHGREEIRPHDITIGEITRASQEKIDEIGVGDTITVNRGTYCIGTFEVLYISKCSPPI